MSILVTDRSNQLCDLHLQCKYESVNEIVAWIIDLRSTDNVEFIGEPYSRESFMEYDKTNDEYPKFLKLYYLTKMGIEAPKLVLQLYINKMESTANITISYVPRSINLEFQIIT